MNKGLKFTLSLTSVHFEPNKTHITPKENQKLCSYQPLAEITKCVLLVF